MSPSQPAGDFHIHHVNVLVDNLEPAVAFYRDVLGLELIDTPDQGFPSQFFRFNASQQLHMNELADEHAFRSHFCVEVPDFMAVLRRARSAGAIDLAPWGKIRRLPSGKLQMFVRDPSGNLIEIASAPHAPLDREALADDMFDATVGNYTMERGKMLQRP
jgi:catechol 2,3-dioxygenase-like lactoylglutathione lyase family enzyme